MTTNVYGQTTIINSQIGDHNTMSNNKSLTENDWKMIEQIFEQNLNEVTDNSELHHFFDESKKYASNKDKVGLQFHFKKNCSEFVKNVLYNMASTGIITLLSKIGITI